VFSIVQRQLRRNRGATIGLLLLTIGILTAISAPLITPYDPIYQDLLAPLRPPSLSHPFGTDEVGRDIFSRIIFGTRISLTMGLMSVAIGGVLGVVLGLLSGFYGGIVDNIIQRAMDLMLSFPGILLALAVVAILGPGLFNIVVAVGVAGIPHFARLARSQTLSIREMEYVSAARAVGCTNRRILRKYILPNLLSTIIVMSSLRVGIAILAASGLSFLGLGAQPPTPEWGAMLSMGRAYLRQAWWITTFPGLAIMITVLALNLFGDGLRDALDPKLRTA
jgi:peptide/nickel transport system permease protein